MSNPLIKTFRYDYILIWGNGGKFRDEIIEMIRQEPVFEILMIHDYKATKVSKLVKAVYSYDYAPFHHLKRKTRYLNTTSPHVTFIFFRNNDPREYYDGDGRFRHIESKTLKHFKNRIRDTYNERKKDRRTEKHVVHASDNQQQTHYMLKYLGFDRGVETFEGSGFIEAPYHIHDLKSITLKKIEIDTLLYRQKVKKGIVRKPPLLKPLEQMPHYKALNGDSGEYVDYYRTFSGKALKDDHSVESLLELESQLNYLEAPFDSSYILVKNNGENYIILDGAHRSAVLKNRGVKELIVAVVDS